MASLNMTSSVFGLKSLLLSNGIQKKNSILRPEFGTKPIFKKSTFSIRASVIESLPTDYGYVALTAAASAIVTQWQGIQVAIQRRKSGIAYPKMYEDEENSLFNCYQRAHQNTLESYPSFLTLLLISGAAYPKTSTVLGMMWVVGRVFYSLGYYTGEPKNRLKGMWGQFGLYGLIISSCVFGVKQLL